MAPSLKSPKLQLARSPKTKKEEPQDKRRQSTWLVASKRTWNKRVDREQGRDVWHEETLTAFGKHFSVFCDLGVPICCVWIILWLVKFVENLLQRLQMSIALHMDRQHAGQDMVHKDSQRVKIESNVMHKKGPCGAFERSVNLVKKPCLLLACVCFFFF